MGGRGLGCRLSPSHRGPPRAASIPSPWRGTGSRSPLPLLTFVHTWRPALPFCVRLPHTMGALKPESSRLFPASPPSRFLHLSISHFWRFSLLAGGEWGRVGPAERGFGVPIQGRGHSRAPHLDHRSHFLSLPPTIEYLGSDSATQIVVWGSHNSKLRAWKSEYGLGRPLMRPVGQGPGSVARRR